jgi:hypothetical protein
MRGAVVAAGLLALAVPGRAASLPGFVLTARTERASYYAHGSARPDVRRIEAYVKELEAQLGATAPESEYYLYGSPEEMAAGTGHYAAGVTFPERHEVHSTLAFHRHELVHLVAGRLGDPGRFFEEGLAVALGDRGRWRGKAVDALARAHSGTASMAALVASFDTDDPERAYPLAGSFVAWLIDTKGLERVRLFFRLSTQDPSGSFETAFGQGLEDAGKAWRRSL